DLGPTRAGNRGPDPLTGKKRTMACNGAKWPTFRTTRTGRSAPCQRPVDPERGQAAQGRRADDSEMEIRARFQARVAELRAEMTAAAVGKLTGAMSDAARRLARLVNNRRSGIAFAAAKAILELGMKLRAAEELEARIKALESGGSK